MALVAPRKDVRSARTKRDNALYRRAATSHDTVWNAMIDVSLACAGRLVGDRETWGSALFTRLCVLNASLSRALPEPHNDPHSSDHWDYSAIAGLSRMILECCLLFHYLTVEDVSDEERRDRINLLHLHDCTARIALHRSLFGNEKEAKKFEIVQAELVARFDNSKLLEGKSEKQKKHLLRGERVMFEIQDTVLVSMDVDITKFRAWYEVLSSHIHSYPLAWHRALFDGRGNGVENNIEKEWITMILTYLQPFLARAVSGMLKLFPDVADPRLRPKPVI